MIRNAQPDPAAVEIIRTGTRLGPVPLVPEIWLHQASEPIGLWQRTELVTGRTGLDPPFWAFAWAGGRALARYLLDHPGTVQGRHAIDVASGRPSGRISDRAFVCRKPAMRPPDGHCGELIRGPGGICLPGTADGKSAELTAADDTKGAGPFRAPEGPLLFLF
jgi:hypothetical protein